MHITPKTSPFCCDVSGSSHFYLWKDNKLLMHSGHCLRYMCMRCCNWSLAPSSIPKLIMIWRDRKATPSLIDKLIVHKMIDTTKWCKFSPNAGMRDMRRDSSLYQLPFPQLHIVLHCMWQIKRIHELWAHPCALAAHTVRTAHTRYISVLHFGVIQWNRSIANDRLSASTSYRTCTMHITYTFTMTYYKWI